MEPIYYTYLRVEVDAAGDTSTTKLVDTSHNIYLQMAKHWDGLIALGYTLVTDELPHISSKTEEVTVAFRRGNSFVTFIVSRNQEA